MSLLIFYDFLQRRACGAGGGGGGGRRGVAVEKDVVKSDLVFLRLRACLHKTWSLFDSVSVSVKMGHVETPCLSS